MRSAAKIVMMACILQAGGLACAQVFRIQAGGSTLIDAEGGSVAFTDSNYQGIVGLGVHEGRFAVGAESKVKFKGNTLLFGDDGVPFNLPTDIFNASHYFFARGAGFLRSTNQSGELPSNIPTERLYVFGGMTATWLGTGFFNSATANDPVGVLFYDRQLNNSVRFVSRNIFSRRQTSLQSLEWSPEKHVRTAFTGGVGSNQHYMASSFDAQSEQFALKASYVMAGDMFRRVDVTSPMSSEVNKDNVELLYRPSDHFSITTGHQNILQPLTNGGPVEKATVNEVVSSFRVEKLYFGAGLFDSETGGQTTQGVNFYGGRNLGQRLQVSANYFESRTKNQRATSMLSGIIRENLTHRFTLLQLVNHSGGQTMVAFGGSITGNRVNVSVDYQNVYLPFRPDHPFEQALAFNADLRIAGPLHVTALSNVAPDGQIRYSFGMSTYLYRRGAAALPATPPSMRRGILRFMVEATVRDDKGAPVEGAALHIGKEVAYTDSSGHLMVRFGKPGPFPVKLVPDEFTTPGVYELVSAPSEVKAEPEATASNFEIVVRRVVMSQDTQTAQKPAPANGPVSENVDDETSGTGSGPHTKPPASSAPISNNLGNSDSEKPATTTVPISENENPGTGAAPTKTPASTPISNNLGNSDSEKPAIGTVPISENENPDTAPAAKPPASSPITLNFEKSESATRPGSGGPSLSQ